jgi:hypothetical protein
VAGVDKIALGSAVDKSFVACQKSYVIKQGTLMVKIDFAANRKKVEEPAPVSTSASPAPGTPRRRHRIRQRLAHDPKKSPGFGLTGFRRSNLHVVEVDHESTHSVTRGPTSLREFSPTTDRYPTGLVVRTSPTSNRRSAIDGDHANHVSTAGSQ